MGYNLIDSWFSRALGILDGRTESPEFDGVRLLVRDYPVARASVDSSRWTVGLASITANLFVPSRATGEGYPYPYDYLLTLSDAFVHTSIAAFGLDAVPMKFLARNLTLGTRVDVCFFDGTGTARSPRWMKWTFSSATLSERTSFRGRSSLLPRKVTRFLFPVTNSF